MTHELLKLESIINYSFKNKSLLKKAMTHRSYATERKISTDNQRLEFLGDAVIEIIVTEYLFKLYPEKQEGELTALRSALVQKNSLAGLAASIHLQDFIFLGKGEIDSGGNTRSSTLCDAFEALLGAVYLDSGFDNARSFLLSMLTNVFPQPNNLLTELNPKGLLQEITQKKWGMKPEYKIRESCGPQHDIVYIIDAYIGGKLYGTGQGKNIKSGETEAARATLQLIQSKSE
jgi:ribonuclease III